MKRSKKFKPQIPKSHYFKADYLSKARWVSYWHQLDEVIKTKPKSVLEIGVGNGLTAWILRNLGFKVTTCDFDISLKPDVVASVIDLPFKRPQFDTVICAQVLEHMPFKYFSLALRNLYTASRGWVIITLPDYSLTDLYFGIKLIPFVTKWTKTIKLRFPLKHKFTGQHYWEIGKKNYPLKKIKQKIIAAGFSITTDFFPDENPYHHFFILKKDW